MKTRSVIVFTVVDGDYCFININIGANGQTSGSEIFRDSNLYIALKNNAPKMYEICVTIGSYTLSLKKNLLSP